MLKLCLWLVLAFVLLGCGRPHADLELQYRLQALESQVQEMQQEIAAQERPQDQELKPTKAPQVSADAQEIALEETQIQENIEQESEQEALQDKALESEAEKLYQQALDSLLQGEPAQARVMLQEFLETHHDHALAPNAYYWLGEAHYVQEKYPQAILTFKEVSNKFPDNHKVPDSLLKMGYAYANMDQLSNARFYLQTLSERYPETKAAELARQRLSELDLE